MRTALRTLANRNARADVEVYRPFFLAGILAVLTAGCALGAVALFGISAQGNYTASVWTPYVLAHANSQLYGWVGFFIVGFALQQHAPRVEKTLLFNALAKWTLVLFAVGIGLRFASEPLVAIDRVFWLPMGVLSATLQFTGVCLFIANIALTRHDNGQNRTWQTRFIYASLGWWLLVAAAEPFYFALSHQTDPMGSILFVAKWFPPYREAQFLGFVTMMIFGVAQVKMNSCFGAREASANWGNVGFALWNVGLIMRMVGWVHYFNSGMQDAGTLYFLSAGALAIGALILVVNTRMFESLSLSLRSHKFIRAALCWLVLGGLLMMLEPLHLRAIGAPFSHAYVGAIRHAITVGFISQMIVGVSLHVVARMNDLPDSALRSLWGVFWLLNVGNSLRVCLEIATDYTSSAFPLMGVTGFVELGALTLWAANVARPMLMSRRRVRA